MMEVSELSQRKKKFKGFKVFELLGDLRYATSKPPVEDKTELASAGEYCPKEIGCCWDYSKKQKEEVNNAA